MKTKTTLIALFTLTLALAGCKEKPQTTPAQAAQPAEQTAPSEELPPSPQEMPGEIRADVPRPENEPSAPEMVTVIGAGEERRLSELTPNFRTV